MPTSSRTKRCRISERFGRTRRSTWYGSARYLKPTCGSLMEKMAGNTRS
jgi:hypothetical protein